jgi:hypothetical protein
MRFTHATKRRIEMRNNTSEKQVRPDEPARDGDPVTPAHHDGDVPGDFTQAQALQCVSALPLAWIEELSSLGEGQKFERMGKAWFYKPPFDVEDCLWEAVVNNGILHVEFEVGPEALRRKLDIPVAALVRQDPGALVRVDERGTTAPERDEEPCPESAAVKPLPPPTIAKVTLDGYKGSATINVTDDRGNNYRIGSRDLASLLVGRKIVETRMAREHLHVTKVE